MQSLDPQSLAGRVWQLIERDDNGNVAAAASRIGLSIGSLVKLLSAEAGMPHPDSLGAVIDGYQVDPLWLILGDPAPSPSAIDPQSRLGLARILAQLAARVFRRHQLADTPAGVAPKCEAQLATFVELMTQFELTAELATHSVDVAREVIADTRNTVAAVRHDRQRRQADARRRELDRVVRQAMRECVHEYVATLRADGRAPTDVIRSVHEVVSLAAARNVRATASAIVERLADQASGWALEACAAGG